MDTYKEVNLLDDIELHSHGSNSTPSIDDSEAARLYPKPTLRRRMATCWHKSLRPRSWWTPKAKVWTCRIISIIVILGIIAGFVVGIRQGVLEDEAKAKKHEMHHKQVEFIADRVGPFPTNGLLAKQDAAMLPLSQLLVVPLPSPSPSLRPQHSLVSQ
ncbi:hypothetical protein HDK77DRAFT_481844 [Phyllosticta capitalensis]|uniref:Uncharacterized protein n=1 Tax=Phyllosticta capitalensis TaxID=121624 RepID=A0ABR1Z4Y7_9PEZI